ncbi:MAG: SNF2-related protein [Acidobacteriota bacterium]
MTEWFPNDRLTHRYNPDLGPGRVLESDGRMIAVHFPRTDDVLKLAANSDALEPLVLKEGDRVGLLSTGEIVTVEEVTEDGMLKLADGRELDEEDVWPVDPSAQPIDRLAKGKVDRLDAFSLRLDSLYLERLRTADKLASFLGGRIRLFPHQLYVAERATERLPVRWLLADEVGLGKTVESCLILNHLIQSGGAGRTLVIAPDTLTVQWLGELWRKYHQVFVLLDEKRVKDVARDYGDDFNPFDAHDRLVMSHEFLADNPRLTEQACEAGIDLIIVDEAHHLKRPPGHPGNQLYRGIEPLAALGTNLLLLSAVPLEDDAHGFFRLLQLLRPDEFTDWESFQANLETGKELPSCTSATRREDIGGLAPRVGTPIDLADDDAWKAQDDLVEAIRAAPVKGIRATRRAIADLKLAMASPAALEKQWQQRSVEENLPLAEAAAAEDPRLEWLVEHAEKWNKAREKTLVFVADRELLDAVRTALNTRTSLRIGIFHEDLSTKQRDIEVAQFRLPEGPSILLCTESGGEGRNFEFCTRLVLYDLPWEPMTVEQRIGRLDRIGRQIPVETCYFRPPGGFGAEIAALYERLGLFEKPLGGFNVALGKLPEAIGKAALSGSRKRQVDLDKVLAEAEAAYDETQRAAYQELHRDPYRAALKEEILARVPEDLDEITEDVIVGACYALGLQIEPHRDGSRHSIELNSRARVDSLPGLAGEHSFLGTFQREVALADEGIDFFAIGHPLVDGLLAHIAEDDTGRVALLRMNEEDEADKGFGLFAVYPTEDGFEGYAVDQRGKERPEWRDRLMERPLKCQKVKTKEWTERPGWEQVIEKMGQFIADRGTPLALAAVRVG